MIIDDAGTHDAEQHGSDNGESDYDLSNDDSDAIDNDGDHFSSHSESDSDESEITASDGSDSEDFWTSLTRVMSRNWKPRLKSRSKKSSLVTENSKRASLMKGFVSVSKTKKDVASVPSKNREQRNEKQIAVPPRRARDNKKHSSDSHAKKPSRPVAARKRNPQRKAQSQSVSFASRLASLFSVRYESVKGAKTNP